MLLMAFSIRDCECFSYHMTKWRVFRMLYYNSDQRFLFSPVLIISCIDLQKTYQVLAKT